MNFLMFIALPYNLLNIFGRSFQPVLPTCRSIEPVLLSLPAGLCHADFLCPSRRPGHYSNEL